MLSQHGKPSGNCTGPTSWVGVIGLVVGLLALHHDHFHDLSGCEVEQACNVLALWGAQVTLLPESTFQLVGLRLQHTV